jgi:hypothetical protein
MQRHHQQKQQANMQGIPLYVTQDAHAFVLHTNAASRLDRRQTHLKMLTAKVWKRKVTSQ